MTWTGFLWADFRAHNACVCVGGEVVGLLLLCDGSILRSARPQCLSCHYSSPSRYILLRITGAKLNMSVGTNGDVWDFEWLFLAGGVFSRGLTEGLWAGHVCLTEESASARWSSQRQFCLTSSLLSSGGLMGPDLSGGVGTSAGKSRVMYIFILHVCVCCRQTESLCVFGWVPPRMLIQWKRCRMFK